MRSISPLLRLLECLVEASVLASQVSLAKQFEHTMILTISAQGLSTIDNLVSRDRITELFMYLKGVYDAFNGRETPPLDFSMLPIGVLKNQQSLYATKSQSQGPSLGSLTHRRCQMK
eukprot:TRINITY_DN34077_c0_g1_i1.p1 TRINITY_DN34077_c0_g1~~TRINITY_DN34077_c0_g1_i1.p1  ORF type:complete len:117 (+),score=13.18 TRINITY_DN34077_c0_g1_i1:111-461(+)